MEVEEEIARADDDKDVGQDHPFERRWRRTQRISWVLLTLFVLAGAAGVFGAGPLSSAVVVSPGGGARVRYQRFARVQNATQIRIEVLRAAPGTRLTIHLSRALSKSIRIERTSPRPLWVRESPDGQTFAFDTSLGTGPLRISFIQELQEPQLLSATLHFSGGAGSVTLQQIVYP